MSETAKSFWHSAGYIPWFTADTASAVGAALRALAISLLGYAVRFHRRRRVARNVVDDRATGCERIRRYLRRQA